MDAFGFLVVWGDFAELEMDWLGHCLKVCFEGASKRLKLIQTLYDLD